MTRHWLKDADELREQFRRRHADRAFEQDENGLVLYAMDNDVITSVTKPWDVAFRPFLRYFLTADEEAQESLAYIIAEYFLRNEPSLPRAPFLLIHPTDLELERLWNTVYAAADRQRDYIEDALVEIRRKLDAREEGANAGQVIKLARDILNILNKRGGEIAELQRIVRVQESQNIVAAQSITVRGMPILPDAIGKAEEEELGVFIKEWLVELDIHRPPPYPASRPISDLTKPKLTAGRWTNNQIDAAVMGRVEWINRQFAMEAKSQVEGEPVKRLCFITGDVNIERIAHKRRWGKSTVAEQFVRNPMCFLASRTFFKVAGVETPNFFARAKNESGAVDVDLAHDPDGEYGGTSLRDWLHVLLPEEKAKAIQALHDPAIEKEIDQASREWAQYVKIAAVSAGLREANEEFEQRLHRLMAEGELFNRLNKLGEEATKIGNDTVTRFGVAGVLAGFWSVGDAKDWPNRNIPAVKFDSFPEAREIIKELLRANTLAAAKDAVSRTSIDRLKAEEPTRYTVFVVFSLAFAIAGEWKSAYTVARAAFSLASNQSEPTVKGKRRVKGDEAAYLCAVFCRLSAESAKDLDPCAQWLAAADERLKMEPLRASLKNVDLTTYRDPRVKAENLHRLLAERQFAQFMPSGQSMRDQMVMTHSLKQLAEDTWAVLDDLKAEELDYIREAVTLQVAMNLLQIQFLATWTHETDAIMPDKAAEAVRLMEEVGKARARKNGTPDDWRFAPHVMFVYYCGSAMFLPSSAGWDEADKAKELLVRVKELRKLVTKRRVMPYDTDRAGMMNSLLRRALKQSPDSY